ncbi:MAG: hypothetical protein H6684_03650 [Deltaproteobacteria bacterium]|nr:hypothetical protein [bacterium]MCB9477379.1 hypothetical protein [Deltaproteobacteria bacterium]MCB9478986.1 hypothetical protein [Deltaproteobacteria bacterium]MCB9487807.1 hypothetical protein [Deltaproteobacteria bacterium]
MDTIRKTLYEKLESYWSEPEPGGFHVCFSGGLDSTAVAYIMGRKYAGPIHLYTLHHDYGSLFIELSRRHVVDLQRIFGEDRVHHVIFNQTETFNRITAKHLLKDWKPYGGHVIWCLGCHLSMLTHSIIRCLEYNLPRNFLCSSVGGEYAVMSMPITRQRMGEIYWEYGIDYRTPLLEMEIDKRAERALLEDAGMWVGYRFRRGVHGVQPICLPCLQHIGDVVFDWHTDYDQSGVDRYIHDKSTVIRAIVDEYFAEKGMDVDALIAANKAMHTRSEPFNHLA